MIQKPIPGMVASEVFDYNTERKHLLLKEYGRNVQNLVAHIKKLEDKELRTNYAHAVIELMKQVNPAVKDTTETAQKLWDDLFIIADFDLDIESPFPEPSPEVVHKAPDRVPYSHKRIRYRHYGWNLELLIQEALQVEDERDRIAAIGFIGRMMKTFYASWNKDAIENDVIYTQMQEMAGGKIDISLEQASELNIFEPQRTNDKPQRQNNHGGGGRNQNNKNHGRRNNNRGNNYSKNRRKN